jgi:hypothetical protein
LLTSWVWPRLTVSTRCLWLRPVRTISLAVPGIVSVTITGLADGTSFVLDDLEYTPAQEVPVPEPGTLSLLALGAVGLIRRRLTRRV